MQPLSNPSQPAWRLDWLTPGRCRAIFVVLMVYGFYSHFQYLRHDCPIDLSGDEAQYWDWSRQLDWAYYSKGPAVAWIIRASTSLFGDQMWAVRLPALVFAVFTSVLTYWITRRLFQSERLALGVILLNHLVPIFVAGSLLMTIEPPYFFAWGLATSFFAIAALENKRYGWIAAGLGMGLGVLAKYGMLLWPIGMFLFLLLDPASRRHLKTPWPYLTLLIGLAFLTPALIWNTQHDWVTFKHVARQTGATHQKTTLNGNFLEFTASQLGVIGPALAVFLGGAIIHALKKMRELQSDALGIRSVGVSDNQDSRANRAIVLLLWAGLPLFAICTLASLRSKMQVNWPAAAYFPWMILTAYFLSTRLQSKEIWKRWRGWFYGAVIFGVVMMPIAHNFELLYPVIKKYYALRNKPLTDTRDIDPTAKLKGWKELGQRLDKELATLNNPFILCEDYMTTAETAFYTPGQPKTFYIGSYISDYAKRNRRTQYDVWPDRNLAQPLLKGRDAIYVGYPNADLRASFKSVEELPEEPIYRQGLKVRRFKLYKCKDFQGLQLQEPGGAF